MGRKLCLGIAAITALSLLSTAASGSQATDATPLVDQVPTDTITDVDGNIYHAIAIGTQVWLVENLGVRRYRDGTPIPLVRVYAEWSHAPTGAYCLPAMEGAPEAPYGLLYNFRAVDDCRGLCPDGWHVPTAAEWRELIASLGGDSLAGSKMKEISSGCWRIHVPGMGNESGFSALPAGGRGRFGGAGDVGDYATWWSSTPHDSMYAWHWGLHPDTHAIRSNPGHVQSGFSVRCIRD